VVGHSRRCTVPLEVQNESPQPLLPLQLLPASSDTMFQDTEDEEISNNNNNNNSVREQRKPMGATANKHPFIHFINK